jgi:hypothetical protein
VAPELGAKVQLHVAPTNVTQIRLGMTIEEAFAVCPRLDREGGPGPNGRDHGQDNGERYMLRFLTVAVNKGRVTEISFNGGYPAPRRETVGKAAEWLLNLLGTPDTVLERVEANGGGFAIIWKRDDLSAACCFRSSGRDFYTYLHVVPPTKDTGKILTFRGGQELPRTTQAILSRLSVWSQAVAHLEPGGNVSPAPASLSTAPYSNPVKPAEKYEVLSGEGLAGSGFVIRFGNALFGVCSVHQFDGKAPGSLEPLEGDPILLDKTKLFRQKDVRVLPVKTSRPNLQFLTYNPAYSLRTGDEVLILGPAGGVEVGTLTPKGMTRGAYTSAEGPGLLEARTSKPFTAAGGSGCPIIQKSTRNVIGVLLSADDDRRARIVEFETLCLPRSR